MEIHWFLVVGSWEACVLITIPIPFSLMANSFSGLWKEHTLVRRPQTMVISKCLLLGQLYDHKRHNFPTRQRSGLNGLFLLRFQGHWQAEPP